MEELERIVLEVLAVKPVWDLGELETAVMRALGRTIDGPLYTEVLTTLQARRLVTIKGKEARRSEPDFPERILESES